MKKVIWYWNLMNYCVYRGFINLFGLMNNVDPFFYILKIPAVKRFFAKRGILDLPGVIKRSVDNPRIGINNTQTSIFMGSLVVLATYAAFNFVQPFFSTSLIDWVFRNDKNGLIFIAILLFPSFLLNYIILYRHNRYLQYYVIFDKMSVKEKNRYSWICFFVTVSVFLLLFYSFRFSK